MERGGGNQMITVDHRGGSLEGTKLIMYNRVRDHEGRGSISDDHP